MPKKRPLTPWFPASVKPVRIGLYRVRVEWLDAVEWCWWCGEGWGWAYPTKRDAAAKEWRTTEGATQAKLWRGLAEKPE